MSPLSEQHECNGEREVTKHYCAHCGVNNEQMRLTRRDIAEARTQAEFAREMAIVALRMLQRAGKLKPTTDDERAAVQMASYMVDTPAANRRLLHPNHPDYVAAATGAALSLFEIEEAA